MHHLPLFLSFFLFLSFLGNVVCLPQEELTAQEGTPDKSPVRCQGPLIPGLSSMRLGVDLTRIDLFPEKERRTVNGFRNNLFSFTCSDNKTWNHPTYPTLPYHLPDQLRPVGRFPQSSREIKYKFDFTQESVKLSMGLSVGIEVATLKGSFSASASYNWAKENILHEKRIVHSSVFRTSGTALSFSTLSRLPFSLELNDTLATLTATYRDDPTPYEAFLQDYGTHFFKEALFGGVTVYKTAIKSQYVYESTAESLSANLKAKYIALSGKLDYQDNTTTTSTDFALNANVKLNVYGGNYIPSSRNDSSYRAEWLKTVARDPWPLEGKLEPIASLILNKTLKKEIQTAVWYRMKRAYTADLRSTLTIGNIQLPTEKEGQLVHIEALLKTANLTESNRTLIEEQLGALFTLVQGMSDRKLLRDYTQAMEDIWFKEFFEAKFNITYSECLDESFEWFLIQQNRLFPSLQQQLKKLSTSAVPDNAQVTSLIPQVASFTHRHGKIDGFCNGNGNCKKCSKNVLTRKNNMRRYIDFFIDKMYVFNKKALHCKIQLAKQCGVKGPFLAQSAEMIQLLADMQRAADEINTRPLQKVDLQTFIKKEYPLLEILQTKPVQLCKPASACQKCVEYHVDCWNKNPDYQSYPCKTDSEWTFVGYRPKEIDAKCQNQKG